MKDLTLEGIQILVDEAKVSFSNKAKEQDNLDKEIKRLSDLQTSGAKILFDVRLRYKRILELQYALTLPPAIDPDGNELILYRVVKVTPRRVRYVKIYDSHEVPRPSDEICASVSTKYSGYLDPFDIEKTIEKYLKK